MRLASTTIFALLLSASGAAVAAGQTAPPVEEQIAGAVLPLPEYQRADATVMGYVEGDTLQVIRPGSNGMICLADRPGDRTYHVACYHESLEPFMRRGRELRAQGIEDPQRDSIRAAEAADGLLPMPDHPAVLHSLTGTVDGWDPATATLRDGSPLHVVYIPWATPESTGLSTVPAPGVPWLMFPGSYKAHIMIMPGGPGES